MHSSQGSDIGPVHLPVIGAVASLVFIVATLAVTASASLVVGAVRRRRNAAAERSPAARR